MHKRSKIRKISFKLPIAVFMLFAVFLPKAQARLEIALEPDRTVYIRYEPIKLTVKISNYTGNTMNFAQPQSPDNHLTLIVVQDKGRKAERINISHLLGKLILNPGETRQFTLTANNLHGFQKTGRYELAAQVGHIRLRTDYRSEPSMIQVRDGVTLWTREVGVPVEKEDGVIPTREIRLMQMHQQEKEIYCLRIEDDKQVFAVLRLGEVILGSQPQCLTDGISNIHVLLRLKSRLFIHRAYDYHGKLLQVQYYMLTATQPELYRDPDDGTISVVGGRPAVRGEDYILTEEGPNPAGELPGTIRRRPGRTQQ